MGDHVHGLFDDDDHNARWWNGVVDHVDHEGVHVRFLSSPQAAPAVPNAVQPGWRDEDGTVLLPASAAARDPTTPSAGVMVPLGQAERAALVASRLAQPAAAAGRSGVPDGPVRRSLQVDIHEVEGEGGSSFPPAQEGVVDLTSSAVPVPRPAVQPPAAGAGEAAAAHITAELTAILTQPSEETQADSQPAGPACSVGACNSPAVTSCTISTPFAGPLSVWACAQCARAIAAGNSAGQRGPSEIGEVASLQGQAPPCQLPPRQPGMGATHAEQLASSMAELQLAHLGVPTPLASCYHQPQYAPGALAADQFGGQPAHQQGAGPLPTSLPPFAASPHTVYPLGPASVGAPYAGQPSPPGSLFQPPTLSALPSGGVPSTGPSQSFPPLGPHDPGASLSLHGPAPGGSYIGASLVRATKEDQARHKAARVVHNLQQASAMRRFDGALGVSPESSQRALTHGLALAFDNNLDCGGPIETSRAVVNSRQVVDAP